MQSLKHDIRTSNFSSSSPSAAARLEKSLQRLGEILGRAEAQSINARAAQRAIQFSQPFRVGRGKFVANRAPAGIELNQFSGFGVLHRKHPRRWQSAFARIVQVQANQVVAGIRQADFLQCVAANTGLRWWPDLACRWEEPTSEL